MSVFVEPVVDRTGMIYVGGIAIETITSDIPIGHFYAISPNGNLAWNFPTVMGVLMPAATNRMGRIVVGDFGGMVYCLAPDGKQIWRRQLAGTLMFSGLLVDDQGTVFILSHNQSALEIISSTLYKLSSTGEIEWSRALDSGCKGSPFLNPDGDVTVVDEQGQVYSFDYAGNSTFNFTMPDAVADNIFAAGAMIHGNSIGYSTLNDTVRFHNYDDTFSFTISFPGEEPKSMPAVNHQNHIVFVSRTTVSPEVSRLNYYNVNVELWDIDLSGEQTSNLAIDNADRMYFSTIHQISGNNGVYCVKPDQSVAWFHSFGEEWVLSVAIASEGLLVCSSVTEGAQAGGVFKITGIYE